MPDLADHGETGAEDLGFSGDSTHDDDLGEQPGDDGDNGDGEEPLHEQPGDETVDGEIPEDTEAPNKRQKTQKEVMKHRKSSNRWHEKWVKKGVPKTQDPTQEGDPSGMPEFEIAGDMMQKDRDIGFYWDTAK